MTAMRLLLAAYLALKTDRVQKKKPENILWKPTVPTLYESWQALAAALYAVMLLNKLIISSTACAKLNGFITFSTMSWIISALSAR